jgi:hypothetical protein
MSKMYESEHTRFMRDWMRDHPEEQAVQQSGRALWWDKPARDLDAQQRLAEARVAQKPYCYDVN